MDLSLRRVSIRQWRVDDAPAIAALADNHRIWINVRDRFPHPYTLLDAEAFIGKHIDGESTNNFAMTVGGEVIGSIGIRPGEDVYRKSAELGYWIGEPYWGRGYATEAVSGFSPWALEAYDLVRLFALVFATNPASARVLEKAGFEFVARVSSAVVKGGLVADELVYNLVRPGWIAGRRVEA
ncbi:MAG: GNAT family N-acetyltransferase [Gemmatimonadota bacterium]